MSAFPPLGPTLVTGGARRLGKAVAQRLAEAGAPIILHANSSRAEAEALAGEIRGAGGRAAVVVGDLAEPGAPARVLQEAAEAIGGAVTGLVNSAAVFEHDTLESFTPELLARQMAVNTAAPVALIQALAQALPMGARGAVLNFLDFKLFNPYPDHLSYTLSKYALAGATEVLARSLCPHIRVNAIAPGYVLPAPDQSPEDYARLHAQTPLGVGAEPAHIAEAALFLMRTPSVTGQTIYVDAGLRFERQERDFAFR